MIKGTYASCNITDISVTGTSAIVTLLIVSTKPAETNKVFNFYIRDKDKLTLLSNTNYWIDHVNNYNNDNINIDINMYKEVKLKIDITNRFTSEMLERKWVRNCSIVMIDVTDDATIESWESNTLDLISKEISLPSITNLDIRLDGSLKIHLNWEYSYSDISDSAYSISNIYTTINIYSKSSNLLIESSDMHSSTKEEFLSEYEYDFPVIIEIILKNLKGTELFKYLYNYKPEIKKTTAFIKTQNGIKKIYAYYIASSSIESNPEWWKDKELKEIEYKGVNFNNADIKLPKLSESNIKLCYAQVPYNGQSRHAIYIVLDKSGADSFDTYEIELTSSYNNNTLYFINNIHGTLYFFLDDLLNEYIQYPVAIEGTDIYKSQVENYVGCLYSGKYIDSIISLKIIGRLSNYSEEKIIKYSLPQLTTAEQVTATNLLMVKGD